MRWCCVSDYDDAMRALPLRFHAGINHGSLREEFQQTCGGIEAAHLPRLYQVETTSRCNLSCAFCPRTTDLVANNLRSTTEDFPVRGLESLLEQMSWVRSVELFHFGEPFMDRNLHLHARTASTHGVAVTLASNMIPASTPRMDAVFASGVDFLVMDVDSLSPERYASARPPATLLALRERVRAALRHKCRPRYITAQSIALPGEAGYTMDEFMRWVGRDCPPPDSVRVKFLDSFRGQASKPTTLKSNELCRESFYGFSVHANGNVVPCDRDWAGEAVMGNVLDEPVLDIWHGERFQEFRRRMKSSDKPDICKECGEGTLVNFRSQPHVQVNHFDGTRVEYGD